VPPVARLTGVLLARAWRGGIDGANRDAFVGLDNLDLHLVGIGAARVLPRVDDRLGAAGQHRPHVAVHTFHFESLPGGDPAVPVEILGGQRGNGTDAQRGREQDGSHSGSPVNACSGGRCSCTAGCTSSRTDARIAVRTAPHTAPRTWVRTLRRIWWRTG